MSKKGKTTDKGIEEDKVFAEEMKTQLADLKKGMLADLKREIKSERENERALRKAELAGIMDELIGRLDVKIKEKVAAGLKPLMIELKELQAVNVKKDQLLKELGDKIDEQEQQAKNRDVILTGMDIKPRSYAAAGNGEEEGDTGNVSVEKQVAMFLRSKAINLDLENVESCFLLPKGKFAKKRAVILKFVSRKHKINLLSQGKKLKGEQIGMSENLTKRKAYLAYQARGLKKCGQVQQTWTRDGRIFIKMNGATPEEAKIVQIKTEEDLDQFRRDED